MSDPVTPDDHTFDDLLANNAEYAARYDQKGFDGYAHAGVLLVTCMDSRIVPLEMVGLKFGDAKIIRTPGGRVNESTVAGSVAAVHLLRVNRIMVIPHSRCAMAAPNDAALVARIQANSGLDADWVRFGADPDQRATLTADVNQLRHHPLIAGRATVGGFYYDVDTGKLERWI